MFPYNRSLCEKTIGDLRPPSLAARVLSYKGKENEHNSAKQPAFS
jgi:hypothetical protein